MAHAEKVFAVRYPAAWEPEILRILKLVEDKGYPYRGFGSYTSKASMLREAMLIGLQQIRKELQKGE